MIQNVLTKIGGVGGYGAVSICLFFAVFGAALLWALTREKSVCDSLSALPLDDGDRKGNSHHE